MMQLRIVPAEGPIYQQIVEQVKATCARGDLRPGERLPPVRDLAEQLGLNHKKVAYAYRLLQQAGVIVSQPGRGTHVAMQEGAGATAYEQLRREIEPAVREALAAGVAPQEIESLIRNGIQNWQRSQQPASADGAEILVRCLGSHDFCLDLLARHLRTTDLRLRLVWTPVGSTTGLLALGRGDAYLAGIHLLDPATGEYNRPAVNRLLPGIEIGLITLADREQGLIVRRGNPLGLNTIADLARPDVRFANRQPGSGTRVLLEHLLALHGLTIAAIAQPTREVTTHLAVAAAVASRAADAAIGVKTAARALDLDFVPLATERYDLAFRRADQGSPWLAALLEVLASPALRADIESMDGYDAARTGWMH